MEGRLKSGVTENGLHGPEIAGRGIDVFGHGATKIMRTCADWQVRLREDRPPEMGDSSATNRLAIE